MAEMAYELPSPTAPFDAVAADYDERFTNSLLGRAQRLRVTHELSRVFHARQRILEINCGTGVDALQLARRGVEVVACDSSPGMIAVARQRLLASPVLQAPLRFEVLATQEIGRLAPRASPAQFDGAFSNFAGLNCVDDLSRVGRDLASLLKPGAPLLLCCFGCLCAWELIWYLARFEPRKAFRRLHRAGSIATLAPGVTLHVRYCAVPAIARAFAPYFRLTRWKGVGIALPPTYAEALARRFPRILHLLTVVEPWLAGCPLLRHLADHVLLELERTNSSSS
jgi:SAM-dependent methyltransferase